MRNRFRKSQRQQSVSSVQSASRPRTGDGDDDSSPRTSVSSVRAPGGGGGGGDVKPLPSVPGMASTGLSRTLSIRAVTSADDKPSEDEASSVGSPSITRSSASHTASSAFSSSVHSNGSSASPSSSPLQNGLHSSGPNGHAGGAVLNGRGRLPSSLSGGGGLPTSVSASSFGSPSSGRTAFYTLSSVHEGNNSTNGNDNGNSNGNSNSNSNPPADEAPAWDATVGKAGLGKTGRVINRLVSDNEALKRDLQIERLKADEARQAARLLEDKMERATSEYEGRLLEASVTKTLLARKERQVESLQAALALEKQRAAEAQERERTWREELARVRREAQQQVEAAEAHAALMDGRYGAISSHWRDEGAAVQRAADRMGAEIRALAAARRADDDKIGRLRDLCDQQDGNIRGLVQQNEALARAFAAYKAEQERQLQHIKTSAAAREAEQERTLAEAHRVLDKLKWALHVKETIPWAG